jgi:hypothetical protein
MASSGRNRTENSMKTTNQKNDPPNDSIATKGLNAGIQKKIMLGIILVLIIMIAGIWIWKNRQINNVQKQAKRQNEILETRARKLVIDANVQSMKMLAKPYVWAVRSELLKGNINQVNLYANNMVKEKNFESIVVANEKGTIISSTDKKNEGTAFSTVGKASYLANDSTIVDNINDSILVMSSPIMGFNNKLGTLIITYKVTPPVF